MFHVKPRARDAKLVTQAGPSHLVIPSQQHHLRLARCCWWPKPAAAGIRFPPHPGSTVGLLCECPHSLIRQCKRHLRVFVDSWLCFVLGLEADSETCTGRGSDPLILVWTNAFVNGFTTIAIEAQNCIPWRKIISFKPSVKLRTRSYFQSPSVCSSATVLVIDGQKTDVVFTTTCAFVTIMLNDSIFCCFPPDVIIYSKTFCICTSPCNSNLANTSTAITFFANLRALLAHF
jgi:hypothetical protein